MRSESDDWLDLICDEFEEAWQRGEHPLLDDYLSRADLAKRPALFIELLFLEVEYRQASGTPMSPHEYLLRFPQFAAQIETVGFAQPRTVSNSNDPAKSEPIASGGTAHVARFELIEKVGSGASGEVWKAFDPRLQRSVAIKLARADALDGRSVHGFLREARAAAQLRHPRIVAVHEVGREENFIYIVSDFIDGMDLRRRLAFGGYDFRDAAELAARIAEALHAAHEQGIIHRDLKPANILIDKAGQPYVTDFGLAKWTSDVRSMTLHGQIVGTPAYMSPEQARGRSASIDRRSDVFALAVILYELLTGQLPFDGNHAQVLAAIIDGNARGARTLNRSIPRDLETICLKGMENEPSRRYSTAKEMADDLRRFLHGDVPLARRIGAVEKACRGIRRRQALAAAVVFGATSLGALTAVRRIRDENRALRGLQVVTLATDPPNAEIVFVPLSPAHGLPLPEKGIRAMGRTPVTQELEPGHYLVIAVLDDGRFHEVERQVPNHPTDTPLGFNHNSWKRRDAGIELPTIVIPTKDITSEMILVAGIREADRQSVPARVVDYAPFFMDRNEYTWGQFKREINRGRWPADQANDAPKENTPMPVPYNQALMCAELSGARLPTELEYVVATAAARMTAVEAPTLDRTGAHPSGGHNRGKVVGAGVTNPLVDLRYGLAEWTSSWGTAADASRGTNESDDILFAHQYRVVWNSAKPDLDGESGTNLNKEAERIAFRQDTASPHVGFRRARSAKPRYFD